MTNTAASNLFKVEGKNKHEFTNEVLCLLEKRKVTFRGCKPNYISMSIDGGVEIQFSGYRDNKPWQGSVKFNCPFPPDKLMLSDPAIVADVCEQGLHLMEVD